jgi:hypothetical protein
MNLGPNVGDTRQSRAHEVDAIALAGVQAALISSTVFERVEDPIGENCEDQNECESNEIDERMMSVTIVIFATEWALHIQASLCPTHVFFMVRTIGRGA